MRYLITVPAPARRISPTRFATESAFVQHLRELKHELGPRFNEIVVAMSAMDDAEWEQQKNALDVVDESTENIRLETLHTHGCSRAEFAAAMPWLLPRMVNLVKQSDFVHTHFSYDLFRPIGAWFGFIASAMHKPVMAITDIDRRRDAEMNFRTGRWSRAAYLRCKYLYDPARTLLMKAYVRHMDMVLFKEVQQLNAHASGGDRVRLFLDPNYSAEHVIDFATVERKLRDLHDNERPLRVLFFGRLVHYKGVDRMLEAVASAHARGAHLTFDIMGVGDLRESLMALTERLGIKHIVNWIAPRPYGPAFFEVLRDHDVLLACPLSADTPRSAWDAFASGLPLVAFDTPFYRSMASWSHAVELTPWPEIEPLADRLWSLARDKRQLVPRVRSAVQAARDNTGERWLRRRVQWVDEIMSKHAGSEHAEPNSVREIPPRSISLGGLRPRSPRPTPLADGTLPEQYHSTPPPRRSDSGGAE